MSKTVFPGGLAKIFLPMICIDMSCTFSTGNLIGLHQLTTLPYPSTRTAIVFRTYFGLPLLLLPLLLLTVSFFSIPLLLPPPPGKLGFSLTALTATYTDHFIILFIFYFNHSSNVCLSGDSELLEDRAHVFSFVCLPS